MLKPLPQYHLRDTPAEFLKSCQLIPLPVSNDSLVTSSTNKLNHLISQPRTVTYRPPHIMDGRGTVEPAHWMVGSIAIWSEEEMLGKDGERGFVLVRRIDYDSCHQDLQAHAHPQLMQNPPPQGLRTSDDEAEPLTQWDIQFYDCVVKHLSARGPISDAEWILWTEMGWSVDDCVFIPN
ncbi:hypothetical protein CPB83DRAFT_857509 [Crepidotus variabilis]|uniref:Uncharacterized protein n=1 Tax=Crepidotus variabilis TaxID=179855 RepID=A0A9P6ECP1_9AGAR|nr:hypothetical protein CPB83DRAFT_857509 [Crepidotus variabilis]